MYMSGYCLHNVSLLIFIYRIIIYISMSTDFELFPGKNLSGLFEDIYNNQINKKKHISEVIFELFIKSEKSCVDTLWLFIFAILFVLPPLKTLPIPQKTNGIIIIATRSPASLPFEKFLRLFSI